MNVLSLPVGLSPDSHSTSRNVFTFYKDNQESVHRPERWLLDVWKITICSFEAAGSPPEPTESFIQNHRQLNSFPAYLHSIPTSSLEDRD